MADFQPENTEMAVKQLWLAKQDYEKRIGALEEKCNSSKTTQQIIDAIPKKARTALSYIFPLEYDSSRKTLRISKDVRIYNKDGISGTLTLDDGANWRVTLVFDKGILTSVTTAASSGAVATWT